MGFHFPGETQELNPTSREKLGGSYIQLSDGVTHYQLGGPEDGAVVVLVHGFTTPMFIWDPTFEFLAAQGFRCLRYDLFGRGFSDRPRSSYSLALFEQQLLELCDGLLPGRKLNLLGLSMGGAVAAHFAAQHPQRVASLVLIDPAGAGKVPLPLTLQLLSLPVLGELLLSLLPKQKLVQIIADDFFKEDAAHQLLEQVQTQLQFRGYRRALLSTFRQGFLSQSQDIYRQLGKNKTPCLLIWGEEDRVAPFEQHKILRSLIPQLHFLPVAGSAHIPHFDQPQLVNKTINQFLLNGGLHGH